MWALHGRRGSQASTSRDWMTTSRHNAVRVCSQVRTAFFSTPTAPYLTPIYFLYILDEILHLVYFTIFVITQNTFFYVLVPHQNPLIPLMIPVSLIRSFLVHAYSGVRCNWIRQSEHVIILSEESLYFRCVSY